MNFNRIAETLAEEAAALLEHKCATIPKAQLHLPGPDFVDRVFVPRIGPIPF
jgi:class I fructose-bisphosphate aldolase